MTASSCDHRFLMLTSGELESLECAGSHPRYHVGSMQDAAAEGEASAARLAVSEGAVSPRPTLREAGGSAHTPGKSQGKMNTNLVAWTKRCCK